MTTFISRTLTSTLGDIEIRVDAPRADATESMDWSCDFHIEGLPEDVIGTAHGIDSVQSLVLALVQIGDRLARMDGLTFLGGHDLGFPVTTWDDSRSTLSFTVRQSMSAAPDAPS